MHLNISGFLKDDSKDSRLKFKYKFESELNQAVLIAMGWTSLEDNADGEAELSDDEIRRIEDATGIKLPSELSLFLGVRSGLPVSSK